MKIEIEGADIEVLHLLEHLTQVGEGRLAEARDVSARLYEDLERSQRHLKEQYERNKKLEAALRDLEKTVPKIANVATPRLVSNDGGYVIRSDEPDLRNLREQRAPAPHVYEIMWLVDAGADAQTCTISFQRGPLGENQRNGVHLEHLLMIIIDVLSFFQEARFACDENRNALDCCKAALAQLELRTMKREMRGVEGTDEP